jgi:hypothetical protein
VLRDLRGSNLNGFLFSNHFIGDRQDKNIEGKKKEKKLLGTFDCGFRLYLCEGIYFRCEIIDARCET